MGFGASSSGGARGEGGSGGAFGDRLGLGLTTGKTWHGTTAFGPAGGMAQGYGMRQANGSLGNLRGMDGGAFGNRAMGGMPGGYAAPVISRPLPPPPAIVPTAAPPPILARPPAPAPAPRPYQPFGPWPGQSAIPPNGPVYSQQRVTQVPKSDFGGMRTYTANDIRRDPGRWE